jgi:hypothetical protein
MTLATTDRRTVDVPVKSFAPVEGRYGPQWELALKYPWSKYQGKGWIPRENDTPIPPATYRCIVERGGLIDESKGTLDWNYKWTIVEFDVADTALTPAAQPAAEASYRAGTGMSVPAAPYVDPEITKRASIERQVALKGAIEWAIAMLQSGADNEQIRILVHADQFYDWLSRKDEPVDLPAPQSEADAEAEYLRGLAAQSPIDNEAPHPADDVRQELPTD